MPPRQPSCLGKGSENTNQNMKRKTTITLTIAGLLGLAGMLYAANHQLFGGVQDPTFHARPTGAPPAPAAPNQLASFFSNVHNPDPSPHQAGPLGVAAAPADLIATEYCAFGNPDPTFTNVDKIACDGSFATIAQIATPGGGGCAELYMTIAPALAMGAVPFPFAPRDYFITAGPNIYQLRQPLSPVLFAHIPDGARPNPGHNTGITFDHEGIPRLDVTMNETCKGTRSL